MKAIQASLRSVLGDMLLSQQPALGVERGDWATGAHELQKLKRVRDAPHRFGSERKRRWRTFTRYLPDLAMANDLVQPVLEISGTSVFINDGCVAHLRLMLGVVVGKPRFHARSNGSVSRPLRILGARA